MSEEMKMSPEEQELLQQQFSRDLENAKAELERAIKNKEEHEFVLNQYVDILDLMLKAKDKVVQHMKVVSPVYEYETLPEYTDLITAQHKLQWEQNIFKIKEQTIPSLEKTVKAKEEGIESLKEKIAKLEGDSDE